MSENPVRVQPRMLWIRGVLLFSLYNKRYGNSCPRFGVFPGLQSTRQGTNLTGISHARNFTLQKLNEYHINCCHCTCLEEKLFFLYRVKQASLRVVFFLGVGGGAGLYVTVRFTHLI